VAQNELGSGLIAQPDPATGIRPQVVVRGSLFDGNREDGMSLAGTDALIEATVVRNTRSSVDDGLRGRGILARRNEQTQERADVTVRDSLLVGNHEAGLFVWGSDLQVESTVVRDTLPADSATNGGRGIELHASSGPAMPSTGTVVGSVIEGNREVAINVYGATLALDRSVLRDTAQNGDGLGGRGVSASDGPVPAAVTVRYSVIEDNHDVGLGVVGVDLDVESTVVRGHRAADNHLMGGAGINAQSYLNNLQDIVNVTVRRSLIDDNAGAGIVVLKGNLTLEASLVRGAVTFEDGTFGDGVVLSGWGGDISGSVVGCRLEDNARAGLAVFGSPISLASSTVTCNAVDINGEIVGPTGFTITDEGNNRCGCDPHTPCKALSTGLAPPEPVEPW
jgi:hypothetical protein